MRQHRLEAIRSVRRRDRAQAFGALKEAFENAETLEIELEQIRQQKASIQSALDASSISGVVTAGRLHMDSLSRSRLSRELSELENIEIKLMEQAAQAKTILNTARDAATKAHKALILLDKEPEK